MATVLDFSILGSLSIVFVWLAVFIAGWALMMKIDFFKLDEGMKKSVYAIMAFAISFLVILSPTFLQIVLFSLPWFTLLLLVAFFFLFFFAMFNPDYKFAELGKKPVVFGFTITFVAIIILFAFANSFGQDLLEEQPGVAQEVDQITGQTGQTDQFVPVDEDFADVSGGTAPAQQQDIGSNIVLTLFHPKILGMFFMLLLATITMLMIARD